MPVTIRKRFSLLQTIIEDITFGLARMYVTPYRFSWTIFILVFSGRDLTESDSENDSSQPLSQSLLAQLPPSGAHMSTPMPKTDPNPSDEHFVKPRGRSVTKRENANKTTGPKRSQSQKPRGRPRTKSNQSDRSASTNRPRSEKANDSRPPSLLRGEADPPNPQRDDQPQPPGQSDGNSAKYKQGEYDRLETLKFATLNVCGLKPRLNYPDFTDYLSNYDILCLAETKLDQTDIVSLPGFECISQPREELFFRRSGGIAVFVKNKFSEYCTYQPSESDYIMWMCIDKRLTDSDENMYLGIVYVPPSQSRFYNDDELSKLENEMIVRLSLLRKTILIPEY